MGTSGSLFFPINRTVDEEEDILTAREQGKLTSRTEGNSYQLAAENIEVH